MTHESLGKINDAIAQMIADAQSANDDLTNNALVEEQGEDEPPPPKGQLLVFATCLATTRFVSGEDLETTITRYAVLYNHHIPQKSRDHNTPVEAIREWQNKRPDLFIKKIRNHTGPDNQFCRSNQLGRRQRRHPETYQNPGDKTSQAQS